MGVKLAKTRFRNDEIREQLEAELETNRRMQSTIENLKRDRDGRIQMRFREKEERSESGEMSDGEVDDSPASKRSKSDEKSSSAEQQDLDTKHGLSSEGGGKTQVRGSQLQLALTPRDFHRPTLKDTHFGTINKYWADIQYCNTCGLSTTRDLDRTTEIPSKALERTIDMQFNAKSNAAKLGAEVVKH